jgi:DNA helicase-2/ATP-dependent DNA helicase PcrA
MTVPELAREVGGQFDHILVDEYQDTNALQATILLGLKPDGYGLTVVGDDAQAIYGFRAANVRNILDFPTLFNPPATLVTLEPNYRSTQGHPGGGQCRHRSGDRALYQDPVFRSSEQ